jgi:DNA-binding transcriptional MerR regulator
VSVDLRAPVRRAHLMSIDDVSEEWGFPIATIRYWVATGRGPKSAKIGRRRLFRRENVEAWIDSAFDEN